MKKIKSILLELRNVMQSESCKFVVNHNFKYDIIDGSKWSKDKILSSFRNIEPRAYTKTVDMTRWISFMKESVEEQYREGGYLIIRVVNFIGYFKEKYNRSKDRKVYLIDFYKSLGFKSVSKKYLVDRYSAY